MSNINAIKYKTYKVKIKNTGYPMDGHEALVLVFEHEPKFYLLCRWKKEDDSIFAESMYKSEMDYGMCIFDNFQEFMEEWNSGTWERLKIIEDVFGDEVDVAPVVHGKWIKKPVYRQDLHGKMIHFCTKYICSACNHESNTLSSGRFCPNCGAKMDLEE